MPESITAILNDLDNLVDQYRLGMGTVDITKIVRPSPMAPAYPVRSNTYTISELYILPSDRVWPGLADLDAGGGGLVRAASCSVARRGTCRIVAPGPGSTRREGPGNPVDTPRWGG